MGEAEATFLLRAVLAAAVLLIGALVQGRMARRMERPPSARRRPEGEETHAP